jgi:hypothetical protein
LRGRWRPRKRTRGRSERGACGQEKGAVREDVEIGIRAIDREGQRCRVGNRLVSNRSKNWRIVRASDGDLHKLTVNDWHAFIVECFKVDEVNALIAWLRSPRERTGGRRSDGRGHCWKRGAIGKQLSANRRRGLTRPCINSRNAERKRRTHRNRFGANRRKYGGPGIWIARKIRYLRNHHHIAVSVGSLAVSYSNFVHPTACGHCRRIRGGDRDGP